MSSQTALIVIDMQNDYYPGGRMELDGVLGAHANIKNLIDYAHGYEVPVYFIQHVANADAPFFAEGTEGVELYHYLPIDAKDTIITKHYPNSFRQTPLHDDLKRQNITQLVVCGAMTHMCVDTTVRVGYDLGYDILLAGDACATKALDFGEEKIDSSYVHRSFLSAIDGTFAKVVNAGDIKL